MSWLCLRVIDRADHQHSCSLAYVSRHLFLIGDGIDIGFEIDIGLFICRCNLFIIYNFQLSSHLCGMQSDTLVTHSHV